MQPEGAKRLHAARPETDSRVLAEGLAFPEGPAFDPSGDLWCVEMTAGRLWRRSPAGDIRTYDVGGRPNGIAVDGEGRIWFCDSGLNAIRRFDPVAEAVTTLLLTVDGRTLDAPNDLAFDAAGNLLFTCPGLSRAEPTGYVCCLTPDGSVRVIADGLYFPNGLAFTQDSASLVIAETRRQRLWVGLWDQKTRCWSERQAFATTAGPIGPDGIAISHNGDAYVAVHGTDQVEIKSSTGEPRGALSLSQGNPTNCAFDPSGALGLVVTEVSRGRVISFPHLGPGLALAYPPAWAEQNQSRTGFTSI